MTDLLCGNVKMKVSKFAILKGEGVGMITIIFDEEQRFC